MKWIIFISSMLFPLLGFAENDYYKDIDESSPEALRASLHSLIKDHITLPYTKSSNREWFDDVYTDVWDALLYTDSACPPEVPKCGLIKTIYLEDIRSIYERNGGPVDANSWDREHTWQKSRGFNKKSLPGYTDLHHLRPADSNQNNAHSDYDFSVGGNFVSETLNDTYAFESFSKKDNAQDTFEPPDSAKGQVARMIFYMAIRYEGNEGDMPDLKVRNGIFSNSKEPVIGDLCILLNWHNEFPATEFEETRNDRVFEIQGNRNPFIDQPEWAVILWSIKCN